MAAQSDMAMKKFLLILILLLSWVGVADTWIDSQTGISWTYRLDGGEAVLGTTNQYGTAVQTIDKSITGSVEIPSSVGGYPVTAIGAGAFYRCKVTEIIMPDSILSVGEAAFGDCSLLQSIKMSSNITSMGQCVFQYCSSLCSVTLPSTLLEIPSCAFDGTSIVSITVPPSVRSLRGSAFVKADKLQVVVLSEGLESIGALAFNGCGLIGSITIPSTVTTIGSGAFSGCKSLNDITFRGGVPSGLNGSNLLSCGSSPQVRYPSKYATSWASVCSASKFNEYTDASDISAWASQWPGFEDRFGTDMTEYLWMESGKKGSDGVDLSVYDEYLMGTNPMDATSRFVLFITVTNNVPTLTWSPAENGIDKKGLPIRSGKRIYKVYGAQTLEDGFGEDPVEEGDESTYHFFKAKVDMPY